MKTTIIGALGYFILPVDLNPNFIRVAGYADDYGVLVATLAAGAFYIVAESKEKTRKKLHDWFGKCDYKKSDEVNVKIEQNEKINSTINEIIK